MKDTVSATPADADAETLCPLCLLPAPLSEEFYVYSSAQGANTTAVVSASCCEACYRGIRSSEQAFAHGSICSLATMLLVAAATGTIGSGNWILWLLAFVVLNVFYAALLNRGNPPVEILSEELQQYVEADARAKLKCFGTKTRRLSAKSPSRR